MWRDLVVLTVVVGLFALCGWLLPRCSLDLTEPPVTTTTTVYVRPEGHGWWKDLPAAMPDGQRSRMRKALASATPEPNRQCMSHALVPDGLPVP